MVNPKCSTIDCTHIAVPIESVGIFTQTFQNNQVEINLKFLYPVCSSCLEETMLRLVKGVSCVDA